VSVRAGSAIGCDGAAALHTHDGHEAAAGLPAYRWKCPSDGDFLIITVWRDRASTGNLTKLQ
jgi:hypothetical protein